MKKVKGFLLSLGVTAVVGAMLFGITALVVSKTGTLPQGAVLSVMVTVLSCMAVFMGGLGASLFTREKGVLFGGACGLFFAGCVILVSLIVFNGEFRVSLVARLAAIFFSGCIGGILGVNRKAKVKF